MIELRVEVTPPRLPAVLQRQVPFALSRALNETAKQFQTTQRAHIQRAFTLRRPEFILRTVKIERGAFATKSRLSVEIAIDPTRPLLGKFERGGRKVARQAPALSVPIEARRGKTGVVPKSQRLEALGFPRSARTRGRRGKARTFLVPTVGVFQRVGRGRAARTRLLFAFKRTVRIPGSLRFAETGRRVFHERFAQNFRTSLRDALRTARL